MSTVLLSHVDRFSPDRLLPALKREVGASGATCTIRRVESHLEVTIDADADAAPLIADGVVAWYYRWRKAWKDI